MPRRANKRTLIIVISIIVLILGSVITLAIVQANRKNDPFVQDPKTTTPTSQQDASSTNDSAPQSNGTEQPPETIDPSTLSVVDVIPMELRVSYLKGIGPFEYVVLRATNGTRYVEFRSSSLVGTKCTNDMGAFASIIESPTESEQATLADTVTVEGETYGLSLNSASCTPDTDALQKYQSSFSYAFPVLAKLD